MVIPSDSCKKGLCSPAMPSPDTVFVGGQIHTLEIPVGQKERKLISKIVLVCGWTSSMVLVKRS